MNFTTFDAVFFTVGFVVPGFIWSAVLSMLVPRKGVATEVRLIEFLTLSCINHGLWSWALMLIFRTGFIEHHPCWSGFCVLGIILLSPIALGLFCGRWQQRARLSRFLGRLGYRTIHPTPTAWDWYFSRQRPCWVLVTLKDGAQVYGLFGAKSFAGDQPECRDLYLEETFELVEDGQWAPTEDTAGVLIVGDQIASIEFRKIAEVSDEREKKQERSARFARRLSAVAGWAQGQGWATIAEPESEGPQAAQGWLGNRPAQAACGR